MNQYLIFFGLILILCCDNKKTKSEGELLAETHCQSCHQRAKPSDLNRETWQKDVLPKMYERLGDSAVSKADWAKIEHYFLENASINLPVDKKRERTTVDTSLFHVLIPELSDVAAYTTLVKIDEKEQSVYYGNAQSRMVYKISANGLRLDSFKVPDAPMVLDKKYLLTMGNFLPTQSDDSYYWRKKQGNGAWEKVISNLHRATDAKFADLNGDNKEDLIISCFGRDIGELAWYENIDTKPIKHILNAYGGMIKSVVYDFNHDNLPDIFALAAQGNERILLYKNKGKGEFEERTLLQFPPSYGSTYFDLVDFNKDGIMDILYVNGDNGDYKPIAKGYHGIRIFTGSKDGTYKEILFLPMNGAFKAVVEDFDQDNDLDIAAISYFPDYENRDEEGFVFFENKGNQVFHRSTIPESRSGKWLVMDVGDIDNDGDKDIVIGAARFLIGDVPVQLKVKWSMKPRAILLIKNKTKH